MGGCNAILDHRYPFKPMSNQDSHLCALPFPETFYCTILLVTIFGVVPNKPKQSLAMRVKFFLDKSNKYHLWNKPTGDIALLPHTSLACWFEFAIFSYISHWLKIKTVALLFLLYYISDNVFYILRMIKIHTSGCPEKDQWSRWQALMTSKQCRLGAAMEHTYIIYMI